MTTTTAALGVGPVPVRVPTPRPKAPASTAAGSESNTALPLPSPMSGTTAQPQPQPGGARRGARSGSTDPLSDRATAFLIRRTLCHQQLDKAKNVSPSIDGLLPPLTSRNDVDLQLYALIAIILREFVQNWYNKVTPDEVFVDEIVHIIAHISRALEQRLRKVDLESLLLDELPDLLDKHITAYRTAHDPIVHHPLTANPREIYHALCPLPALSPVPRSGDAASIAGHAENEGAYRQLLVHAILAVLLPTEDLENPCLTALVGQIFSELIVANAVANKLSEPWLIYEVLIIASRVVQARRAAGNDDPSGSLASKGSSDGRRVLSIQAMFWAILQWGFLATSFIRTIFTILVFSRSTPSRLARDSRNKGDTTDEKIRIESPQPLNLAETGPEPVKTPVLAFRCWAAISNLVELDVRMPWLRGTLSLLQWIAVTGPGRIADVDGKLDRLLSFGINRHLLDPASLPPLLRNVRGALFPNNMPGSPTLVAPSSEAELLALRRRCAKALWALVPNQRGIGRLFFNGSLFGSVSSRHGKDNGVLGVDGNSGHSRGALASAVAPRAMTAAEAEGSAQQRQGSGDSSEQGLRSAPNSGGGGGSGNSNSRSRGGQPHLMPADGRAPPPPSTAAGASATATPQQQTTGAAATLATHDARSPPPAAGEVHRHTDTLEEKDDAEKTAILAEIERGLLAVFGDAYCNKHLIYGILELVLVRLLPELAEKGVMELWAERLA